MLDQDDKAAEKMLQDLMCTNCCQHPVDPKYQDWGFCTACGLMAAADLKWYAALCDGAGIVNGPEPDFDGTANG